jgi:hypothetical protein
MAGETSSGVCAIPNPESANPRYPPPTGGTPPDTDAAEERPARPGLGGSESLGAKKREELAGSRNQGREDLHSAHS